MLNIGLLITRNEEDIIEEVLKENTKHIKIIYALDGSDDNTPLIIKKFPEVRYLITEKTLDIKNAVDGVRQYLLEQIKKDFGDNGWITIMHGDEIFYNDPNEMINIAEQNNCDSVKWRLAHFFLHTEDFKSWEEIKNKPLQERITWYCYHDDQSNPKIPLYEDRQFKNVKDIFYQKDFHHSTLPFGYNFKPCEHHPVIKHYRVRNFEQVKQMRIDDTEKNLKWGQIHYHPKEFKEIFKDGHCGIPNVQKFNGSFPITI